MQKIFKAICLGSLFLIPIFPLIVANSFFFPFITGKAFYFRLLVELAFSAWIVLMFLDAKYRPKVSSLTISVTLFAVIALIADLLGVNPIRSIWSNFERMEGWMIIIHLWALFMVMTSAFGHAFKEAKRLWHRWFNVSLLVAFILALYAIAQLLGWVAVHQSSVRVDATLGNAAYMAVYMLFHVFLAAYMYFVARKKEIANWAALSWIYPILAVLFGFIVFETQTRGTVLGLIGGIILSLALYAVFARREPKKGRLISAGVIAAIILIGVIFWLNRNAAFIQNSNVLNRLATISWSEVSGQARQYVWPMAVKGGLERPILGWGQENFNYIFNANYNPAMYNQEQWFDRAHNVFLDWLVASGFLGLIAYLALYVLFLVAVWKSELGISQKSVLTGLLAAYALHNVFVFDNLASYVMFFAMLGFASSLLRSRPIRFLGTNPVRQDAVEYIVLPITAIALAAVIYIFNVRPIQANTRLISALQACGSNPDASLFESALAVNTYVANQEIREQLLNCSAGVLGSQNVPNPTKQAFYTLAEEQIKKQIEATPNDARIYVLAGSFWNGIGLAAKAEPLLVKAHELTPAKQSVTIELASADLQLGKNDQALALLKQAYESETSNFEAKTAYAYGLILAGKEAEARNLFKNDASIFETARAANIFVSLKQYDKAIAIYQKLAAADPSSVELKAQLAQIQYMAGYIYQSIQTLRSIEKDNPNLKDQIEATIKQIQK